MRSVPLLPDEIISSWLVRAALAQGCDPMVLTGEVWPKWRIWTRDADRFLDDAPLNKLTAPAGIPLSSFRAATLKSVAERVSKGPLPDRPCGHGYWRWERGIPSGEAVCSIVLIVCAMTVFLIIACNGVSRGMWVASIIIVRC